MEKLVNLSRVEKDNVHRMLDGCICRICVSDDEHEIVRLIGSANHYIAQLGCNNIRRVRECEQQNITKLLELLDQTDRYISQIDFITVLNEKGLFYVFRRMGGIGVLLLNEHNARYVRESPTEEVQ